MIGGLHILTQNKTMKCLAVPEMGQGESRGGDTEGAIQPMYNISLLGIVILNALYTTNIC
jgi:hypothetical protein